MLDPDQAFIDQPVRGQPPVRDIAPNGAFAYSKEVGSLLYTEQFPWRVLIHSLPLSDVEDPMQATGYDKLRGYA